MSERPTRINIPLFILSMVLALFLWAIVYLQTTTFVKDRIYPVLQPAGLDPEKYAIIEAPPNFSVEVTGTSKQIADLEKQKVIAQVDARQVFDGPHQYRVYLPKNALDLATDPNLTAQYTIEPLRQRTLPIVVTTTKELADPSHVYTDCVVSPKSVTVRATRENLTKIASARVEVDLSKVDANKPEPITCDVFLVDENGHRLVDVGQFSPLSTDVTPILAPSNVKKSVFLNVPFRGTPAQGWVNTGFTVSPNQVTITGSPNAVNMLAQVETDTIDLTGFDTDRTIMVSIHLPPGVSTAAPSQVRVKVSVRKSGTGSDGGQ